MNTGLSFQYPLWFLLLCVGVGAAYALLLYYRDHTFNDKAEGSRYFNYAMAAFRFLSVTILAVLLLSPFIRSRKTQEFKPIIAVIHDNSESVKNGLKSDSALYEQNLRNLISSLSGKYEVAEFSAGDELKSGIDFSYRDKSTNLSAALEEVNNLFYNRNLGAVVVASDGIYNKGVNPVYAASQSSYPIYTIALGDTTIQKDQKISNVYYNKIVYLNDRFALRADVEADNLAGKDVKLNVYEVETGKEPRLIQSQDIAYSSESYFQSFDFILPAGKTGIARYRMALTNVEGEITYRNNVRDVFIEVLDGRQKILLVAHSPHPDISAFKSAIESNQNYQVDVEYAETFSKKLNEYNLIILHQLPSSSQKIMNLLNEAAELKKSLLFVVGSQTSLADFEKSQICLSIKAGKDRFNEVTALRNKDFALFTLSDNTLQTIPKLPPFHCFFGEFTANPSSKTIMYQKINSVETDFPLWTMNETGDRKTGVIAGEGLWRWRLHDFLLNKNHDATNELINKTVQYLSVKSDKRPFKVSLTRNVFQDNEAIVFDAQLYNANYELINAPDVELKIASEEGDTYDYRFGKTENAYSLNAGFLPVGNYTYTARTKSGNTPYTASGKFSVSPLQLEELQTRADHRVLYQLASQHQGAMHYLSDLEKIAEEIDSKNKLKPILFDSYLTVVAIELEWILFLLLLLISAEWFIRKYLGGY